MDWTVLTYLAYLAVSLPLVVWVARTLTENGKVFLADVFEGNETLAAAVNKLLVVGFYLLNLGFVSLYLRAGGEVRDAAGLFATLSVKIGVVTVTLGVIHFINVYVFNAIRRRHKLDSFRTAPLAPQAWVPPQGQPQQFGPQFGPVPPQGYGPAYPARPR